MTAVTDIESPPPQSDTPTDTFLNVCLPCSLIVATISFVGAIITNCVFSIIALVETSHKELQEDCPETNIWIYLLVILITSNSTTRIACKSLTDSKDNGVVLGCSLISNLAIIIWGGYELWGINCVDKSNLIYTMVSINVIAYLVITILSFIYMTLRCVYK